MQAAHESYADNPSSSTSQKNRDKQNEDMKGAQFIVQSNLRILARSIAALSKISEDVHIEVSENGLFFKVFHRCKHCVFRFAPEFFNSCDLSMINKKAANICRLSMKSAQRIFKGVTFGDKNFVGCEFRIDPKAEKMIVNLQMNYDINRMIHAKLREMSTPLQKPKYDRLRYRNKTVVFASTLIPIMAQMKADIEVTFKVDKNGLTIRNFHSVEGGTTSFNATDFKGGKKVRTETTVHVDKLSRHEVAFPIEFSFSMKDFLAIATFADQLGSEICMYYDLPPRPMILSIEAHANFDIELAMTTLGNDDEVDLDGGVLTTEAVVIEEPAEPETTQRKHRKDSAAEEINITSSSSSRSKRGPRNTQDAPMSSSKRTSQISRNVHASPVSTPVPVAQRSWRDNEVEMEDPPANEQEPEVQVSDNRSDEIHDFMDMDVEPMPERDPVPEVTIQAMQDFSLHRGENSRIRDHEGADERREAMEDFERSNRAPEVKRKKTSPYRNKRLRRILMGTKPGVMMRMSEQFTGPPLVMDTQ